MLIFIFDVIFWVIFVYGFLSLAQDIFYEITYHKVNHDMKIFIFAKNLENRLDEFIEQFRNLKKGTVNKNVTLIDLTKTDNFDLIDKKLKSEEINWKFINSVEGENLIMNQFKLQ